MVKQLIMSLLKADLDLDNDGTKESVSAFFTFKTTAVKVSGLIP